VVVAVRVVKVKEVRRRKMYPSKLVLTGVVLGGMFMASEVKALQITPNVGTYYSWSSGKGGELTAQGGVASVYGGNYSDKAKQGNAFITFCIEENEYFYPNCTYDVTLNHAAVNGGVGDLDPTTPGEDHLSQGTAYLYSMFASGTLNGYHYQGGNRLTDAGLLQEAIWSLEDERGPVTGNKFYDQAIEKFKLLGGAKADNHGRYGVAVMNLKGVTPSSNYGNAQDLLVIVSVPDGGWSMVMLSVGLASLSAVQRRFRKA
jgi:hypothetical protein